MAQVLIRNLPERAVQVHRDRARAKGSSLEAELREVVQQSAELTPEEKRSLVREWQVAWNASRVPGVEATPGWVLIREDRDSDDR